MRKKAAIAYETHQRVVRKNEQLREYIAEAVINVAMIDLPAGSSSPSPAYTNKREAVSKLARAIQ